MAKRIESKKRKITETKNKYINFDLTENSIDESERLQSTAKHILSDHILKLSSVLLQEILFLKASSKHSTRNDDTKKMADQSLEHV